VPLADDEFRVRLRGVLVRAGLSMRRLSDALGRDPGYVAASLDPSRPSRARPTPDDLLAASDVTSIPFVELLAQLWGIPPERLADELRELGIGGLTVGDQTSLTPRERAGVADYVDFLAARHRQGADH